MLHPPARGRRCGRTHLGRREETTRLVLAEVDQLADPVRRLLLLKQLNHRRPVLGNQILHKSPGKGRGRCEEIVVDIQYLIATAAATTAATAFGPPPNHADS